MIQRIHLVERRYDLATLYGRQRMKILDGDKLGQELNRPVGIHNIHSGRQVLAATTGTYAGIDAVLQLNRVNVCWMIPRDRRL